MFTSMGSMFTSMGPSEEPVYPRANLEHQTQSTRTQHANDALSAKPRSVLRLKESHLDGSRSAVALGSPAQLSWAQSGA